MVEEDSANMREGVGHGGPEAEEAECKVNEGIMLLMRSVIQLHEEACAIYKPEVDAICCRIAAEKEVESLLDRMLSFAGYDNMLAMYKRVCRHYWEVYPQLVYDYVMLWRDMYDSDEDG